MTNHASHSQDARDPTVRQINVEGLTKAKREVIQHLGQKHRAVGILLQETHLTKDEQFNIFRLQHHSWNTSPQTWYCHICTIGCTEWSRSTTMDGVTTINAYMLPNIHFTHLPQYPHPAIYAGDFNCQNTLWRYRNNTTDGTMLNDWASNIELTLLYYNRQPNSVCSGRWQTQTNPDLAFTTSNSAHTNCVR